MCVYLIKIAEILKPECSLFLLIKTNSRPSVMVITYSCKGKTASPLVISKPGSNTTSWVVYQLSFISVCHASNPKCHRETGTNSSVSVLWKLITFKVDRIPFAFYNNAVIIACYCSIFDCNLKYFFKMIDLFFSDSSSHLKLINKNKIR